MVVGSLGVHFNVGMFNLNVQSSIKKSLKIGSRAHMNHIKIFVTLSIYRFTILNKLHILSCQYIIRGMRSVKVIKKNLLVLMILNTYNDSVV